MPEGPGFWKGKYAMFPLAGKNKTVVLDSGSEFRPAPPPDFAKDMAEMKNFKRTFSSNANAFFGPARVSGMNRLTKKYLNTICISIRPVQRGYMRSPRSDTMMALSHAGTPSTHTGASGRINMIQPIIRLYQRRHSLVILRDTLQ